MIKEPNRTPINQEKVKEILAKMPIRKACALSMISGGSIPCKEEGCAWWVSSTGMCVVKDLAHTLKLILGGKVNGKNGNA